MIVGETCTGKSEIIKTLKNIFNKLNQEYPDNPDFKKAKIYKLNPKAVPLQNLYGYVNFHTNDWNDGIIASIVREAVDD